MTDREDPGEEAIKAAREKFAKKADDPPGIASAKVGSKSIKDSLDETDPQRKSQVLPQMYNQFGKIQNILKSSSSGQQGQNQTQIDAGQPDYYKDLDGDTKRMLTSALTFNWTNLVRNFGYEKVLKNIELATTGKYTKKEADNVGIKIEIDPTTYKFDMLSPDYQDVVSGSILLLSKLIEKYGEKEVPFLDPFAVRKPKTWRTPPNLVQTPSKYSILEYYTTDELPEVIIDGSVAISNSSLLNADDRNFIFANNALLENGDIVKYVTDSDKNSITNLKNKEYYYVISANSSGFKISSSVNGKPINISPKANTGGTFFGLEKYSGYAEWYTLNGQIEYMPRDYGQQIDAVGVVTNLFISILNRPPDSEGLTYWTEKFKTDISLSGYDQALKNLQDNIKQSGEYKEKPSSSGAFNAEKIVKDMFLSLLGRMPDDASLAYWSERFTNDVNLYGYGEALKIFENDIKQSDEYSQKPASITNDKQSIFWPDFDNPELHVVYLSAFSMSYDMFSIVLNDSLEINFLAKILDSYTRKIENDFMDLTLGWGMSADQGAKNTSFPSQNNGGGGGSGQSMLTQLLPQLKQMLQQSKTKHLPNSVLQQGKMQKLLENLEQKKTENKRMSNLADSAIGAGGLGGLGGFGGLAGLGGLGNMAGMGGFGNILSGGNIMGGMSGMGSIFGGGDIGSLISSASGAMGMFNKKSGSSSGGSYMPTSTTTTTTTTKNYYTINGQKIDVIGTVTNMYTGLLGRQPAADELTYWTDRFASEISLYGYDKAVILLEGYFKDSTEYKQKSGSSNVSTPVNIPAPITNIKGTRYTINGKEVDVVNVVNNMFISVLKREPDQESLIYWCDRFSNDVALYGYEQAVKLLESYFKNSLEYKQTIQLDQLKHIVGIEGLL